MKLFFLISLISVTLFVKNCSCSEKVDKCEFCVKVLQCVYGQFGKNVRSKRLLEHKLQGTCKRYPQYRKACLELTKNNLMKIFNGLQPGTYNPHQTCTEVQECHQDLISLTTMNPKESSLNNSVVVGSSQN